VSATSATAALLQNAPSSSNRRRSTAFSLRLTEQARESLQAWIYSISLHADDYLFPSRTRRSLHLSTRPYARIVHSWVREIGLDENAYSAPFSC